MDNKYIIDNSANRDFLRDNACSLLKFGIKYPSEGGSSYYLDGKGEPMKEMNRETWITSRMVHVYSMGSMLAEGKTAEEYRDLATAGLKGLRGELHDHKNGGWYAGLTPEGRIVEGKQCYAHAFVMLAASSAYLAGIDGAKELLDDAKSLYDLRFWDDNIGLSCDMWDTAFSKCDEYRGLNANMHTVEAFLAVADALEDASYRERAGRIIRRVAKWAEEMEWRIPEHFNSDWKPLPELNKDRPDDQFKPYGATPGHGIEWSRLIAQWAVSDKSISKEERDKYIDVSVSLYKRATSDAWCADGAEGLVYTTDWEGKPVVRDRMHWTLAEAINTSAVLYRITKDPAYSADYGILMSYLDRYVIDHETGSWYHQLDENNRLKETVWPGKPDIYHAFQAMMIPYLPPEMSVAKAVQTAR